MVFDWIVYFRLTYLIGSPKMWIGKLEYTIILGNFLIVQSEQPEILDRRFGWAGYVWPLQNLKIKYL